MGLRPRKGRNKKKDEGGSETSDNQIWHSLKISRVDQAVTMPLKMSAEEYRGCRVIFGHLFLGFLIFFYSLRNMLTKYDEDKIYNG